MAKNSQKNPWISIWTQPKKTIRSIVNADPKACFLFLCAAYGLPLAFNLVQTFSLSQALPLWAILIGSLVACVFLGMVGISVAAWLVQVTGRWIGGKGDFQVVRAAVAWSNVPNVVTIALWGILLLIFGGEALDRDFAEMQFVGYQAGILFLVMLIESILSVWGFIILINTLAEVQGFSVWKAVLNVVIPVAIVFTAIWLTERIIWGAGTIS